MLNTYLQVDSFYAQMQKAISSFLYTNLCKTEKKKVKIYGAGIMKTCVPVCGKFMSSTFIISGYVCYARADWIFVCAFGDGDLLLLLQWTFLIGAGVTDH